MLSSASLIHKFLGELQSELRKISDFFCLYRFFAVVQSGEEKVPPKRKRSLGKLETSGGTINRGAYRPPDFTYKKESAGKRLRGSSQRR